MSAGLGLKGGHAEGEPAVRIRRYLIAHVQTLIAALGQNLRVPPELIEQPVNVSLYRRVDRAARLAALLHLGDRDVGEAVSVIIEIVPQGDHLYQRAQHRDLFYKLLVQKYAEHPCTMVVSTHLIAEVADLIEHTVIIRKGRILQDAPTEELTAACWAVSGPAGVVDSWAAGRDVFTSSVLGGLKTVCIRGGGTEDLPAGLERRRVGLQEYFISLMEEEDQR